MGKMDVEAYKKQLIGARQEIRKMIDSLNCNPIMVRLAWHDSGTYDVNTNQGGADGSIRFKEELAHGANAGLMKAVKYLEPIKEKFPLVSWADLMQMASAEAVYLAGGPIIPMRYGRIDASAPAKEGNLPDALPPFHGGKHKTPADHLRAVFYRMGFGDREIVALSGAHTIGRAFKERSGATEDMQGKGTKFTNGSCPVRFDGAEGVGMKGGRSWTQNWLTFDNSYFNLPRVNKEGGKDSSDQLAWFPTDAVLALDAGFKPYFELYAKSQDAFFEDYAEAHRRLSELGSSWAVPGGIMIPMAMPKSRL